MEEGWQGEDSWRGPVGDRRRPWPSRRRPWPSRGQARPPRRAPPLPALLPVSLSPKGLGALSSPPHFHSSPPRSLCLWPWFSRPPSPPSASAMDAKVVAVLALVLAALCLSDGKPVSLSYRCPCRFFETYVARANVKHIKILNTPNCTIQIVAKLKSNNRQVCIDPKVKWIQEYLEKALNKRFKM